MGLSARPEKTRRGHTMVELVAATALMAVALVPTLALIRDSIEMSRRTETQYKLATLCVSKLEEHLALGAASWTSISTAGDFSGTGQTTIHFEVDRSDAALDGGIPDQLMAVTITVWEDADDDDVRDSTELQMTLSSKIAKMAVYEDEASS